MSFAIFTDGCSNLPGRLLRELDIHVLPCTYTVEGEAVTFSGDIEQFDSKAYYNQLRAGMDIKTSLLNTQLFIDHFRPCLEQGLDVLYVGLSSGVSGTYQASCMAAEELMEEFPGRTVRTVDSRGASLGVGILTCRGADFRAEGLDVNAAADALVKESDHLCQYFTVDDLNFLKRTGRVSGATAAIGTVLNIKPLLYGDEEGHIVARAKVRGRKKAIEAILDLYAKKAVNPENGRVAITHGDCPEEAQLLAHRVCQIAQPKDLIVCPHEPFTGVHVGPGMLALYFFGDCR